ncbi:MAG: hypothetical protein SF123_12905 [Chloroflexota bacterium]|nr:hypothetical protein [Chloroflexota bacterium]
MRSSRLVCALVCLLLVGCVAPALPWGAPRIITQAEQTQPPALAVLDNGVTAAWVGADERGVHHNARRLVNGTFEPAVTLPLPPIMPRQQTFVAGRAGSAHLLWLDANENGDTRLFNALIATSNLSVLRGPTVASEGVTVRYATLAEAGGVLVAWSGGLADEPTVTLRRIDDEGRPTETLATVPDADYPQLLYADGTVWFFWQRVSDQTMRAASFIGGSLSEPIALVPSVGMAAGDRLHDIRAGAERSQVYLFWNVNRGDGREESWFASGALSATGWSAPRLLTAEPADGTASPTGFNSGRVQAAAAGAAPVEFAAPLPEQGDTLPVAALQGDALVVIYLQSGQPIAMQTLATGVTLLAAPLLLTDLDRYLYLSWAQPRDGAGELRLLTTRN